MSLADHMGVFQFFELYTFLTEATQCVLSPLCFHQQLVNSLHRDLLADKRSLVHNTECASVQFTLDHQIRRSDRQAEPIEYLLELCHM